MESSILSEVDDTSILRTELPAPLWLSSQLATGLSPRAPRSGLERSDFVLWHRPDEPITIERVGSLALSGPAYIGPEPTRLTQSCPSRRLTEVSQKGRIQWLHRRHANDRDVAQTRRSGRPG